MIKIIEDLLALEGYGRVKTNITYVTLYTKYYDNKARAVQLFDCENAMRVNKDQVKTFNIKAAEFLRSKGYEDVALINIVCAEDMEKAKGLLAVGNNCWIIDSAACRLRIYESQPQDFEGLKKTITDRLYSVNPLNEDDLDDASKKCGGFELNKMMIQEEEDAFFRNMTYGSFVSPIDTTMEVNKAKAKGISKNSIYIGNSRITLVNTIIVAINVLVFFWLSSNGPIGDGRYLVDEGAMYAPLIAKGQFYRLFTSMFIHASFEHLIGNMLVLMALGDNVERAVGWVRYLLIYIGGGLFASFVSFLFALCYNPNTPSVGASGAIFAAIGGLLWIVASNGGELEDITTLRIAFLIVYSLYSGLTSKNVDNAAHIGGLIGGFLIAFLLYRKKKDMV